MCDYPKGREETVMVEMSVENWKKLNKIKEDMTHARGKPVSTNEALFELFYGRY